ncbi:molybdopterin-dependent oxidoreductase [Pseudoalteromonas sp. B193]
MSSAVAGYKRAFGEDVAPCTYEDLEQTELLILIGSNAAWTHPVLYQRMERAKRA